MGGIKGRKSAARLEARIKAFEAIPGGGASNPGKQDSTGHKMHKPGSNKK